MDHRLIRLFLNAEQSKLAREFGFKQETLYYHFPDPNLGKDGKYLLVGRNTYIGKDFMPLCEQVKEGVYNNTLPAPTYEEFFSWLEDEKKLCVSLMKRLTGKWTFYISTFDITRCVWDTEGNVISWLDKKEAQDKAFDEIIAILQSNENTKK